MVFDSVGGTDDASMAVTAGRTPAAPVEEAESGEDAGEEGDTVCDVATEGAESGGATGVGVAS